MIKWFSALIFTNVILNCNSVTLLNRETDLIQAGNALAVITHNEALPLPLFVIRLEGALRLRAPADIAKAEIVNRVMVQGTQFSLRTSERQLFFCPSATPELTCLDPHEFNNSEPLRCTEALRVAVMQDIDPNRSACNFRVDGVSHRVSYEICPSDQYGYITPEFMVYKICYDMANGKTLFTRHSILSPKLLFSPLLLREQEVDYPYEETNDGLVPANYLEIIIARNMQPRPRYMPQRLVPAEDMALGVWRKTTYKPFNLEFQRESVMGVWDEICQKLREQANQHRFHTKYIISTGVFDSQYTSRFRAIPDGQMYNRWIKLVIAKSTQNDRVFGGSVYLMNNFLDDDFEVFEHGQHYLQQLNNEMEGYCQKDHCKDDFKQRVTTARGTVRCCEVTKEIGEWFGYEFDETLEFLPIDGLSTDEFKVQSRRNRN